MNDDLIAQIERMRLEMIMNTPKVAAHLTQLEQHLLHERDATVNHIRHIATIRHQSDAVIREELEALRTVLTYQQQPEQPQIPDVEERFVAPRFIREAAE